MFLCLCARKIWRALLTCIINFINFVIVNKRLADFRFHQLY